jgi:hypothetical protein
MNEVLRSGHPNPQVLEFSTLEERDLLKVI